MFKISPKKIENKKWEHQWFPKLREIFFKAEMSADGRTDWLTDSQNSLSSFYNIDKQSKLGLAILITGMPNGDFFFLHPHNMWSKFYHDLKLFKSLY